MKRRILIGCLGGPNAKKREMDCSRINFLQITLIFNTLLHYLTLFITVEIYSFALCLSVKC